jgi:membrane associated rhomboid family serine protease
LVTLTRVSLRERMRVVWREARENNRRPEPGTEPRFDPSSWSGALVLMCGFVAVLWIVQLVNAGDHYRLNRFGMHPRETDGLWGIVTEPFLHDGYGHLASNTLPVLLVGWALMISGLRDWLTVTAIVIVLGDAATWLAAPSGTIVGANALVFGWLGYLIARAIFSRKVRWILTAAVVLLIFGTLLGNLLPSYHSTHSWQAHVCGFGAGLLAGAVLHQRPGRGRSGRSRGRGGPGTRPAEGSPVS